MKKSKESGFAMLLVFLMAATIAITLYLEIPRVAFQAQRQKEQLLIERGEQYKRAIQLFVRVNGRYPGDLKDLENFNNRRFLRHKFLDPMTGKDDWRIVHINNGVLTDSVLNKQKPGDASQQAASTAGQYVGEQAAIGAGLTPAQQNVNSALTRRRVSEGGAAPTVGPDGQPLTPGQSYPGQPITGITPIPGQPMPGQPMQGQPIAQPFPGQPQAQPFTGAQTLPGQVPGQPFPGVPTNPGQMPAQPFQGTQQSFPGQVQGQPFASAQQSFPGQVQAQPFPGAQPTPGTPIPPELGNTGLNPSQPIPGRLPAFTAPGVPANPNPNSNSGGQTYVGGSQPYVGGSQPYVGGGQYIGSQPTPTSGVPQAPPFTPSPVTPQPVPNQPNFPVGGVPQPFGAPQPGGTQQPAGTPQPFGATQPFPTQQSPNTGFPGPGGQSPATDMINNILRNPRPVQAGTAPGGQQIGGGIAGVASKSENAAIMVYNDRTNYNEWEFVFDYTKQTPLPNPNGGTIGTSAASLGTVAGTPSPVATPTANTALGAGFGATPTAGPQGQSPFGQPQGQSPFGQPQGQQSPFGQPQGQNPSGQPGAQGAGTPQLPPGLRPGRP